ncbi:uncharacterized protein G2W53_010251 [Senna tora]|uniref:Uncharacterized protein n=1 Tax=Senna tora TaxID=362788 RepID=A0A834X0M6_9FABA|nr:uncharacterized protein G2W53_010251 [Senna tora]
MNPASVIVAVPELRDVVASSFIATCLHHSLHHEEAIEWQTKPPKSVVDGDDSQVVSTSERSLRQQQSSGKIASLFYQQGAKIERAGEAILVKKKDSKHTE